MCRIGTFKPANPQTAKTSEPLPLKAVDYCIKLLDFAAEVVLRQTFTNAESSPIEAVYEFILDPNSTITAFSAIVDGRKVVGRVKEKTKAKDQYDDALASGSGGFLLEQDADRPEVFSVNVGNLPPSSQCVVSITYVTETTPPEKDTGAVLFTIPAAMSGTKAPEGVAVSFKVLLDMTCAIKSVTSKTHPITLEFGDTPQTAVVTLATEGATGGGLLGAPEGFALTVQLRQPNEPAVRLQEGAVMATFYPQLEEEVFSEILFLVDRSGSMAGSSMKQTKAALELFLKSLPEGTMFNIVSFGSFMKKLFESGSVEYNDTTLQKAIAYVQTMEANMGGTDILKPLMDVFNTPTKPGIPRQIFLLTDGQVKNRDECIAKVRDNAGSTRVFCFGIGNECDVELVRGMSKAGEGQCEMVRDIANMKSKVIKLLDKALKPAITDLKMNWGPLADVVSQTPFVLPPLFGGNRLIVYGLLNKPPTAATGELVLTGKMGDREVVCRAVFDQTKASLEGTQIVKLAVRSLLRDLADGHSCLKVSTADQAIKESITLSVKHGVLCKHTAFVAIDEREDATEGTMQQRLIKLAPLPQQQQQQPIAVTSSSHLMFGMAKPPAAPSASFGMMRSGSGGGRGGATLGFNAITTRSSSSVDKGCAAPRMMASGFAPPPAPPSRSVAYNDASFAPPPPPPPPGAPAAAAPRSSSMMKEVEEKMKKTKSSSAIGGLFSRRKAESSPRERSSSRDKAMEGSIDDLLDASYDEEEQKVGGGCPPAPQLQQQRVSAMQPPKPVASSTISASTSSLVNLTQLIASQKANGSFTMASLAQSTADTGLISGDQAIAAAPSPAIKGNQQAEDAWATVLVLAVLKGMFADKEDEWGLLAKKALKWAMKILKEISATVNWESAAQQYLHSINLL